MARLDFFLVTTDLFNKSVDFRVSFGYRTDHSFISAKFNLQNSTHGKWFWKLNTSLLYDKYYIKLIKHTIAETLKTYSPDNAAPEEPLSLTISDQMFFEMLKLAIRGQTSFASFKSRLYKKRKMSE